MNVKDYIGIAYALAAAILWGLVYNFDQRILAKTSPLAILFLGSFITAVVTLPFAMSGWESIKPALFPENRQFLYFFIATQVIVILAEFFIFSSIQTVGASIASFFEIAYPLFVAIFAFIIFDGKLNIYFWVGALFMFIGSVIITKLS